MKVTEVRINPAKGGKVRAFASIVIDDCFIVNDLRIHEGKEDQLFVTMPARKVRSGQLRDIAYPLDAETRRQIEEKVIEEYQVAVENLAIPDAATKKGQQPGVLDRLAHRLFNEDFWTVDAQPQDGESS